MNSKLANISTRGLVGTGDNVLIGGFIVLGIDAQEVIVRAIGASLPVMGKLADPTLELYDSNGVLLASNDNWRDTQEAEIIASTIPPTNDAESALVETLPPAAYTAICGEGPGPAGVALVEVYALQSTTAPGWRFARSRLIDQAWTPGSDLKHTRIILFKPRRAMVGQVRLKPAAKTSPSDAEIPGDVDILTVLKPEGLKIMEALAGSHAFQPWQISPSSLRINRDHDLAVRRRRRSIIYNILVSSPRNYPASWLPALTVGCLSTGSIGLHRVIP